jgi:hypothetical protein
MGNLASAVDELLAVDARSLPGPALAAQIIELRRQINRCEAAYLEMLEVFDRSGGAAATHGSTAAWARDQLCLSPSTGSRDVHLARDLADVLPATRAALADGRLSPTHAQIIASLRDVISADALAAAEPHLVEWAEKATPKELRQVVTHVRQSYAADKLVRDEAEDYAARRLDAPATIHGIGVGRFSLHPHGYETVMTAIHAASRPVSGDDRTPAQRRADALITIAEIALRSGELPITGGVKPHVSVIVNASCLTGETGAAAADFSFGATASTEWARRVACDAEISRVVFGPAGEILDAGRAMRTFSAAQTRAIVARDRHCIWPGCDMPPGWCEAHHCLHWADGGHTSVINGALICGRHHDRVHAEGHAIHPTPNGPYVVDLRPASDPRWTGHRNRAGPRQRS